MSFVGFHEGMADIVTLSFQTPEHMKVLGFIDEVPADDSELFNWHHAKGAHHLMDILI